MDTYYLSVAGLGLLGLIFLVLGSGMLSTESKKHKGCTQETTARVRELKEKQSGKPGKPGSVRYYPVFEYRANGQLIREESKIGSDKPVYKAGDEVKIFYNPDNKREFYISDSKSASVIGSVFTILGISAVLAIAVITTKH